MNVVGAVLVVIADLAQEIGSSSEKPASIDRMDCWGMPQRCRPFLGLVTVIRLCSPVGGIRDRARLLPTRKMLKVVWKQVQQGWRGRDP